MNRLEEILCVKRAEVQRLLPRRKELQRLAEVEGEYRGFRAALKRRDDQIAIIAEIKKASPSSGLIAEPFDPIGMFPCRSCGRILLSTRSRSQSQS